MSKKKIKDFLQEIDSFDSEGNPVKHEILDYIKIGEDEALFYLVITERGLKAKSTQAKYLNKYIGDEYRSRSMGVMNSEKLIEKEARSHLKKPKQFHKDRFTEDMVVKNGMVYEDLKDKENGGYTKFASLSTAENEKGSRDDYEVLVLDEFNVGDRQIKKQKTMLLSSLLATLDDPINSNDPNAKKLRKIIMHGNNKSLNDDFLIKLDILSIKDEITDIVVDGQLIGRIIFPIMTDTAKNEVRERNKENKLFLLQKALGMEDHVYFNETLFDEVNFVNRWMLALDVLDRYVIKVQDHYFEFRVVDSKDIGSCLYVIPIDKSDIPKNVEITALNAGSMAEGIGVNENLKKNLRKYLGECLLYFHSQYVREVVIKEIIK